MSHSNMLDQNSASRFSDLEQSVEHLSSYIKQLDTQLSNCVNSNKQMAQAISRLEVGQRCLLNYTRMLEDYCLELDVSMHKKTFNVTGIPEEANEYISNTENPDSESGSIATQNVIFNKLSQIHDTLTFDDIDCAICIGRKGTKPCPVLIKFCKESCTG